MLDGFCHPIILLVPQRRIKRGIQHKADYTREDSALNGVVDDSSDRRLFLEMACHLGLFFFVCESSSCYPFMVYLLPVGLFFSEYRCCTTY